MADLDDKEILILETIRTALVDGIDSDGNAVAPAGSPTYGGTSSGEDFSTLDMEGNESPFNIYVEYLDELDSPADPEIPFILVSVEGPVPNIDFCNGVQGFALTVSVRAFISNMYGRTKIGSTTYSEEKASRIFRKRIIDLLNNIRFPNVEIYERSFVEPMEIGYPSTEDDWTITSGASLTIQYVPEI